MKLNLMFCISLPLQLIIYLFLTIGQVYSAPDLRMHNTFLAPAPGIHVLQGYLDETNSLPLVFNSKMMEFMRRLKAAQARLNHEGLDLDIYIGSGEIRRAILQMHLDGPGDVEVFLHFNNRQITPLHVRKSLTLLKSMYGFDLEQLVHDVFGPEKKLDLFVKDMHSLESNFPYRGEFSFFENMGDNTLNRVLLNIDTHTLHSDEESLRALKDRRILFTEPDKAKQQETPVKITGITGGIARSRLDAIHPDLAEILLQQKFLSVPESDTEKSFYLINPDKRNVNPERLTKLIPSLTLPQAEETLLIIHENRFRFSPFKPTILRMALRNLRLYLDLAVTGNPLQFKIDQEFAFVMHGFEHFFGSLHPAEIGQYKLEMEYLEQFLKIFRNRSPEELKKIYHTLLHEFPHTMKIFGYLGLNAEILCTQSENHQSAELMAIIHNAYFLNLIPYYNASSGQINDPFSSENENFLITPGKKNEEEILYHIPERYMRIYSSKLLYQKKYFNRLSFFDQTKAIAAYIEALKFFNGPASRKIQTEKFRQSIYDYPFISGYIQRNHPDASFLEILELSERSPISPSVVYRPENINRRTFDMIDRQIDLIHHTGGQAVMIMDIDNTISCSSERVYRILKQYDEIYGTHYFTSLNPESISSSLHEEFLYRYFGIFHPHDIYTHKHIDHIMHYLLNEFRLYEVIREDKPFEPIRQKIIEWKNKNVKIIFITARPDSAGPLTQDQLMSWKAFDPDKDVLITKPFSGQNRVSVPRFKTQEIQKYFIQNPHETPVAFFEDKSENLAMAETRMKTGKLISAMTRSLPKIQGRTESGWLALKDKFSDLQTQHTSLLKSISQEANWLQKLMDTATTEDKEKLNQQIHLLSQLALALNASKIRISSISKGLTLCINSLKQDQKKRVRPEKPEARQQREEFRKSTLQTLRNQRRYIKKQLEYVHSKLNQNDLLFPAMMLIKADPTGRDIIITPWGNTPMPQFTPPRIKFRMKHSRSA